jgi:hypothetical protein
VFTRARGSAYKQSATTSFQGRALFRAADGAETPLRGAVQFCNRCNLLQEIEVVQWLVQEVALQWWVTFPFSGNSSTTPEFSHFQEDTTTESHRSHTHGAAGTEAARFLLRIRQGLSRSPASSLISESRRSPTPDLRQSRESPAWWAKLHTGCPLAYCLDSNRRETVR